MRIDPESRRPFPVAALLSVAAMLLLSVGCSRIRTGEPPGVEKGFGSGSPWVELPESGLFQARFFLPRSQFENLLWEGVRSADGDPFYGPANQDKKFTPEEWLEWRIGAPVPEGGGIDYDGEAEILTVTHDKMALKWIELTLGGERTLDFRLEIFQVPELLALRLERSAAEGYDHRPEWRKLLELMREHEGEKRFRLVGALNLSCRSGQRAKVESGEKVEYFESYEGDDSTEVLSPKAVVAARTVGTSLAIDPVLSVDGRTLDLAIDLEHHTAAPVEVKESIRVPGRVEPVETEVRRFHAVSLQHQITMLDGQAKLLGCWRPRGDADAERRGLRQVAFLIVNVQNSIYR